MTVTALRRRRVDTTPASESLGALVARLRRSRKLTQSQLARNAGLKGSSTVSRLEAGRVDNVSRDLMAALAEQFESNENELWAAAGALPPQAVAALASYWGAYGADLLREHTSAAVRRIHLRAKAEQFLADSHLLGPNRIKVEDLAAALTPTSRRLRWVSDGAGPPVFFDSTTIRVTVRRPRDVSTVDDPAAQAAQATAQDRDNALGRFLTAHAVAHILLADETCEWPHMDLAEVAADELACHLLVPSGVLDLAFNRALTVRAPDIVTDGWNFDTSGLTDRVARQVGAPAWVVVRRIAEDDLLQNLAQDSL